jgi:hypothetical protein
MPDEWNEARWASTGPRLFGYLGDSLPSSSRSNRSTSPDGLIPKHAGKHLISLVPRGEELDGSLDLVADDG